MVICVEPTDQYLTSDLGESAFLGAQHVEPLELRTEGSRVVFVFPASAGDVASRFWRPGQDLVSARAFHRSLRELRARIQRELGR